VGLSKEQLSLRLKLELSTYAALSPSPRAHLHTDPSSGRLMDGDRPQLQGTGKDCVLSQVYTTCKCVSTHTDTRHHPPNRLNIRAHRLHTL
jgi:hypothetical protein